MVASYRAVIGDARQCADIKNVFIFHDDYCIIYSMFFLFYVCACIIHCIHSTLSMQPTSVAVHGHASIVVFVYMYMYVPEVLNVTGIHMY